MCSHISKVHWPGLKTGTRLASKEEEEEDASMWPHAGCGAGEEDGMGRVAP